MAGRTSAHSAGKRHTVVLVLGGARSGKSAFAEAEALRLARGKSKALYMATAEAGDREMRTRIAMHRARRGTAWTTLEIPLELPAAIDAHARPGAPILVDCLTLWLSNLLAAGRDVAAQTDLLCKALKRAKGPVVLVSNEVGLGIVPDNALARAFRDHAGRLHQAVGAVAARVAFVAAGLPIFLKGPKK
ncbi:MAG: bifunctional adenosylcobinamide kinase/adenosylcobinamide-phosphate guanylyltransferase [Alphaproteobacteria bacterium]|nr:bifunctional adenosylcobinamide kinase/adenosylcobinamide-phosphate guanylyltransferase [Alphaproteobacteria bacterium]